MIFKFEEDHFNAAHVVMVTQVSSINSFKVILSNGTERKYEYDDAIATEEARQRFVLHWTLAFEHDVPDSPDHS